jgi:hypothetical protein
VLTHLRGQEDRFFMGPELTVFHVAPGEVLARVVNGFRVVVSRDALPSSAGDCVVRVPAEAVVLGVTCTRSAVRVRSVPVVLESQGLRLDLAALQEVSR